MSDWAKANIELRRRRDEMDAFKKRESEASAGCDCHGNVAYCPRVGCPRGLNETAAPFGFPAWAHLPSGDRPAVRPGGH